MWFSVKDEAEAEICAEAVGGRVGCVEETGR